MSTILADPCRNFQGIVKIETRVLREIFHISLDSNVHIHQNSPLYTFFITKKSRSTFVQMLFQRFSFNLWEHCSTGGSLKRVHSVFM